MASVTLHVDEPGQVGSVPRFVRLTTDASYSELTAAGFLKNEGVNQLKETDLVFANYAGNTKAFLTPSISNGVVTLVEAINLVNHTISLQDGSVGNLPLNFVDAPTTGFYRDSVNDSIILVIDGISRLAINDTGPEILNSAETPASVFSIDEQQLLEAPVAGYVVPAGTAITDASSLNGDTASADDATIRLVIQALKGVMNGTLTHGFFTGAP